jgi:hypothetical protein
MQVNNRIELKLENFDKCHLECDHNTPLGVLYDYSFALQGFILEKMKAAQAMQEANKPQVKTDIEPE